MRFSRPRTGRGGWTKWIQPVANGYRLKCCDCGLVHEMDFRVAGVRKQRVQYRARRTTKEKA